MTACVNKKHSRRVAAAVSASLVGALTLGAAPAVVMAAEEAPVEQQFADPEGAFSNAKVVTASFDHLGSRFPVKDADGDGVYTTEFQKNKPVVLNEFTVKMIGGAEAGKTLTIPPMTPITESSTSPAGPTASLPAMPSRRISALPASTS